MIHLADWSVVFGLSFWALSLCALIVGTTLAPLFRYGKAMCSVAVIGVLLVSLNYRFGFLPAFLWIMAWHALSALFLWHERHGNIGE